MGQGIAIPAPRTKRSRSPKGLPPLYILEDSSNAAATTGATHAPASNAAMTPRKKIPANPAAEGIFKLLRKRDIP